MTAASQSGRKMGVVMGREMNTFERNRADLVLERIIEFAFADLITKFAFAVLFIILFVTTIYTEKLVTLLPFLVIFTKLFGLRHTGCEKRTNSNFLRPGLNLMFLHKSNGCEKHKLLNHPCLQQNYGKSSKTDGDGKSLLIEKDANIQSCCGKAEVAQPMRSAAPKDKASPQKHANPIQYQCGGGVQVHNRQADPDDEPVNSILLNQIATPQKHANPIQYQYGGGGQVHNQQADPDDEPVNSTLPNLTVNAPATFDIEDGGAVSTPVNSSPPNSTVSHREGPSNIESGTSFSQAVNQTPPHDDDDDDNGANESTPPNEYHEGTFGLENAFMMGSQILSTAAAIWANNGSSGMSSEAQYLHYVLLWCIFLSLISSFYSLFLSDRIRPSIAARIARRIAYVSTALALLTAAGLQLPNPLMLWGTLGAYFVSMPAIIGYAMK